jgi:hypothetical protein
VTGSMSLKYAPASALQDDIVRDTLFLTTQECRKSVVLDLPNHTTLSARGHFNSDWGLEVSLVPVAPLRHSWYKNPSILPFPLSSQPPCHLHLAGVPSPVLVSTSDTMLMSPPANHSLIVCYPLPFHQPSDGQLACLSASTLDINICYYMLASSFGLMPSPLHAILLLATPRIPGVRNLRKYFSSIYGIPC